MGAAVRPRALGATGAARAGRRAARCVRAAHRRVRLRPPGSRAATCHQARPGCGTSTRPTARSGQAAWPSARAGARLGEQHDAVDAHGARLRDRVQQPVAPAQAVHAGHGRDRQVLLAVVDEHRQDEVGRRNVRLGDGAADGRAAPVAPRPRRQHLPAPRSSGARRARQQREALRLRARCCESGLTCGGTTGVPGGLPALCACVRSSLCSAPTCARTGSGARAFSPAPHLALTALCCWRPLQVCSNGLHLLRVPVVAAPPMRITGCPARQGPGRGAAGGQCVGAHHRPVTCVVPWQLQS